MRSKTTKLPRLWDIAPVLYKPAREVRVPAKAICTSHRALFRRAGLRFLATIPPRTLYVHQGTLQVSTADFDLIGVPVNPRSKEGAMRAIEALAFCFFDHAVKHSLYKVRPFVPEEIISESTDRASL